MRPVSSCVWSCVSSLILSIALSFTLSCVLSVSADAQTESYDFSKSGNEFLRLCDKKDDTSLMHGACVGYVMGVQDAFEDAFALGATMRKETLKPSVCPPPEVTVGQKFHVAIKFMNDHPEQDHMTPSVLIFEALVHAFPCPASPSGPPSNPQSPQQSPQPTKPK
jgi:Rap1a immunity proteins